MNVIKIQEEYNDYKYLLDNYIANFQFEGKPYGNQDRNPLKLFDLNGKMMQSSGVIISAALSSN